MGAIEIAQLRASWQAQEDYLPLFFETRFIQSAEAGKGGGKSIHSRRPDRWGGRPGEVHGLPAPPGDPAQFRHHVEPERRVLTAGELLQKSLRPLLSWGQAAKPEMPARPRTLGSGASGRESGRRGARGPSHERGPLCLLGGRGKAWRGPSPFWVQP